MLAGQVQPEIVVFLNKKERTYLSYLPREAKWRTATIIKDYGLFLWEFLSLYQKRLGIIQEIF